MLANLSQISKSVKHTSKHEKSLIAGSSLDMLGVFSSTFSTRTYKNKRPQISYTSTFQLGSFLFYI